MGALLALGEQVEQPLQFGGSYLQVRGEFRPGLFRAAVLSWFDGCPVSPPCAMSSSATIGTAWAGSRVPDATEPDETSARDLGGERHAVADREERIVLA